MSRPIPTALRKSYVQGPEDQRLRLVERDVDLGDDGRFLVAVGGDAAEIDDEVLAFDGAIVTTFLVLAAVLLLTTLFQVRFGLAPLKRISRGLAAIRSGKAEKLAGAFPVEIEPLARETNALIDANREIVERARTHVGNLAHALKTPLSVMMNEAAARGDDPLADKVREQTGIMRDQVTRHLERARIAARVAVVGTITDVVPVVQALARTMEKTHHDKNIAIDLDIQAAEARFRGERQDLEEMVGNLVDNACKWAGSRVSIEVMLEQPEPGRQVVRIVVDDDGPGLTPTQREQVVAARPAARRDQARLGARAVDRGGACRALRRRAESRHRADRRLARGAGAAGGVRRLFFCPGRGLLLSSLSPAFFFPAFFHNSLLASRAPSVSACSFAQTMLGWTSLLPAKVAKPQSEPAITRSFPTRLAIFHDALGHQLRMLDQHGRMADHARDQHLVLRQLGIPPDLPLVLVARVRRLERIGAGVDLQDDVEQVLDLHVVHARSHVDAVAGVVADFLRRDAAQRMVERLDTRFAPICGIRRCWRRAAPGNRRRAADRRSAAGSRRRRSPCIPRASPRRWRTAYSSCVL